RRLRGVDPRPPRPRRDLDRPDERGYFADSHGWDTAVEDIHTVSLALQRAHPGLPIFFFGHSMGSLLGRDYATRYGQDLSGAVFSGTAAHPGLLGRVGEAVAKVESRVRGRRATSRLMRSEEHTSELQSRFDLVCRLLLE